MCVCRANFEEVGNGSARDVLAIFNEVDSMRVDARARPSKV